MQRLIRGVDPLVFWGSVGSSTAFVLWGVLGTGQPRSVMGSALDWVIQNFGWGFVLIAAGALLFCIFLAVQSVRAHPARPRRQTGRSSRPCRGSR